MNVNFCGQWRKSTIQREKNDEVTEEDLEQVANSASEKRFCKDLVSISCMFQYITLSMNEKFLC